MAWLEKRLEVILNKKEEESLRDTSPFKWLKYHLSCRITGKRQSLLETHCTADFGKENKEKDAHHLIYRDTDRLWSAGNWGKTAGG